MKQWIEINTKKERLYENGEGKNIVGTSELKL